MILFISNKDYANVGFEFSEALRSIGENAESIAITPHHFEYSPTSNIPKTNKEIVNLVENANTVVFMHSHFVDTDVNLKNKNVAVFHGGTPYRMFQTELDTIFNKIVNVSLLQHAEFFNGNAKNPKYVILPVDTNNIKPNNKPTNLPCNFCHFPSSMKTKNSSDIICLMNKKYKNRFFYNNLTINHKENLKQINDYDVYIDNINVHHGISMSTCEAAAMGKLVINSMSENDITEYTKLTGQLPSVFLANDIAHLNSQIVKITLYNDEQFNNAKLQTRNWIEKFHSYNYVGNLLKKLLAN